jgi:hypothetical protein
LAGAQDREDGLTLGKKQGKGTILSADDKTRGAQKVSPQIACRNKQDIHLGKVEGCCLGIV